MDRHALRTVPGLSRDGVVPGVLGRLLRRRTLRHEGRRRRRPFASSCVRRSATGSDPDIPMSMRHFVAPETAGAERRQFAEDVEYYLSLSPRQLPSRYLYDELGSALVRRDLPSPGGTKSHGPSGSCWRSHARQIRVNSSRWRTRRAWSGQRREAGRRARCRADDAALTVHLVDISSSALETASRALDDRRQHHHRHAPGRLRGRAGGGDDQHENRAAPRPDAGVVPRFEHRQLRSAGGGRVSAQHPYSALTRRCAARRRGSREK